MRMKVLRMKSKEYDQGNSSIGKNRNSYQHFSLGQERSPNACSSTQSTFSGGWESQLSCVLALFFFWSSPSDFKLYWNQGLPFAVWETAHMWIVCKSVFWILATWLTPEPPVCTASVGQAAQVVLLLLREGSSLSTSWMESGACLLKVDSRPLRDHHLLIS